MSDARAGFMISADSHSVIPADLFETRLDRKLRARAPRVESRADADYLVVEGLPPGRYDGALGSMAETMWAGEASGPARLYRYLEQRPGAGDPVARIADQDLDHVCAEVVYPSWLTRWCIADLELRAAVMRTYNDWFAETFLASSRFLGAAELPVSLADLSLAIREAERSAALGFGTLMIPHHADDPYGDPAYAPLWRALEDIGLPVAIHVGSGVRSMHQGHSTHASNWNAAATLSKVGLNSAAVELIWGAVPLRHPKLRFVMVEGGIGWIAFTLNYMDHWWKDHKLRIEPRLDELPSEIFSRHFWATFEDDRPGILTLPLLNADHMMWGNDYPHTEGTWPRSREQIDRDMGDLPEALRWKLVRDNAASLYGLGG